MYTEKVPRTEAAELPFAPVNQNSSPPGATSWVHPTPSVLPFDTAMLRTAGKPVSSSRAMNAGYSWGATAPWMVICCACVEVGSGKPLTWSGSSVVLMPAMAARSNTPSQPGSIATKSSSVIAAHSSIFTFSICMPCGTFTPECGAS